MNKSPSVKITNRLNQNQDAVSKDNIRIDVPTALAGSRLDSALAKLAPQFSRARLSAWIKQAQVLVNSQPSIPKQKLIGGEKIEIFCSPDAQVTAFHPEPLALSVVFEDADLLIIDKPAGLVVHPASGNWSGTLLNGLLAYLPALSRVPRAGIVHRLDKDTSGLMMVAKNTAAQIQLVRQLQARTVSRLYRALIIGHLPASGKISTLIGRNPHNRLKMAVVPTGGKEAVTHVEILEYCQDTTYIQCALETGRTHQIRLHLSHAGYPLVGDPVYKSPRRYNAMTADSAKLITTFKRQALHAFSLSFTHPLNGKKMNFTSPLPNDMRSLLTALKNNPEDRA